MEIVPATVKDIEHIRKVAENTWPNAYGKILSVAQLEYMLDKMYSTNSLASQFSSGIQFILAKNVEQVVGFASWSLTDMQKGIFHLHKIYVLPSEQGKKTGRLLLDFVIEDITNKSGKYLRLNVNRNNAARHFYEKLGFRIIEEVDIPIGNNYFMNDFIMEKKLTH
ncbi:MAG: GNAT family N-acetyltransferase [Bacteroidetes bacterium]|nr:GNAT family N-acetyltransferase [Bacteroidota bacterium]